MSKKTLVETRHPGDCAAHDACDDYGGRVCGEGGASGGAETIQAASKAGITLVDNITEESSLSEIINAMRKTLVPMLAEKLKEKVLSALRLRE